jgi:hypothetical protein
MELLILGGLTVLIVLAAISDRGEREVETVLIALPVPRPGTNPLVPLMVALLVILLAVILVDRAGMLIGM